MAAMIRYDGQDRARLSVDRSVTGPVSGSECSSRDGLLHASQPVLGLGVERVAGDGQAVPGACLFPSVQRLADLAELEEESGVGMMVTTDSRIVRVKQVAAGGEVEVLLGLGVGKSPKRQPQALNRVAVFGFLVEGGPEVGDGLARLAGMQRQLAAQDVQPGVVRGPFAHKGLGRLGLTAFDGELSAQRASVGIGIRAKGGAPLRRRQAGWSIESSSPAPAAMPGRPGPR